MHERVERGKCDAHVGRIGRDAGRRSCRGSHGWVQAVDRRAAAAGMSLVAGRGRVIEIARSACAASGCRQQEAISRNCAEAPARMARQQRGRAARQADRRRDPIRYQGADAQPLRRTLLDLAERQAEMSISGRPFDISFIRSIRFVPPAISLAPGSAAQQADRHRRHRGSWSIESRSWLPHCLLDRGDDVRIGAAAAEISAHQLPDLAASGTAFGSSPPPSNICPGVQ